MSVHERPIRFMNKKGTEYYIEKHVNGEVSIVDFLNNREKAVKLAQELAEEEGLAFCRHLDLHLLN